MQTSSSERLQITAFNLRIGIMHSNHFPSVTAFTEAGEGSNRDLNCAETILYGADEAYGLHLSHPCRTMAAGFGGGMGVEKACGALTGSVMALSVLFTLDRGHESDYLKGLCKELFARFEAEMGDSECTPLKEAHRTEEIGCKNVILAAARILDDIVKREAGNRVR